MNDTREQQSKIGDGPHEVGTGDHFSVTSIPQREDVILRIVAATLLIHLIFAGIVAYFMILEREYAIINQYMTDVVVVPRPYIFLSAWFGALVISLWLGRLMWQNFEMHRKMAELEIARRTLRVAVDTSGNHIVLTDEDGMVTYANQAAEDVTGFSLEEMLGKKAGNSESWGGLMDREFYTKMWKMIKVDKEAFLAELTNKRKSGEQYKALLSIAPVLDDDGTVISFVEVERDITKQQEIDQSKTDFVSMASHQLRTPLSAINWYTEMLLDGDAGKITETQKDYLREIYGGVKRMIDLVNALLNRSRLELGTFRVEPEEIDLRQIGDSIFKDLRPMIDEKNLKIVREYAKNLPKIHADPRLMRIILENLLSNAVKYTSAGGTVKLVLKQDGKDIHMEIHDTGCGIPKHEQGQIFSKLFRAENVQEMQTEGTGLGLFIVKSILDNTVGNVWFESEEGKGTVFYITIPVRGMRKKVGTKTLEPKDIGGTPREEETESSKKKGSSGPKRSSSNRKKRKTSKGPKDGKKKKS